MEEKRSGITTVGKVLFGIYCLTMLWLLFGQRIGSGSASYTEQLQSSVNFIPFRTIRWFLTVGEKTSNQYLLRHAFVNLTGNVILFIPLGIFFPGLWKGLRSFWKLLLCLIAVILGVELLQLLTLLGSCDIDDLILNLFGALLGYGLWLLCRPRHRKKEQ